MSYVIGVTLGQKKKHVERHTLWEAFSAAESTLDKLVSAQILTPNDRALAQSLMDGNRARAEQADNNWQGMGIAGALWHIGIFPSAIATVVEQRDGAWVVVAWEERTQAGVDTAAHPRGS